MKKEEVAVVTRLRAAVLSETGQKATSIDLKGDKVIVKLKNQIQPSALPTLKEIAVMHSCELSIEYPD